MSQNYNYSKNQTDVYNNYLTFHNKKLPDQKIISQKNIALKGQENIQANIPETQQAPQTA